MVFEREGCLLEYHDQGSGPAVVLSHGAGMDHRMFDPQVPALLALGYRVITWDLRLHGGSRPSTEPVTPGRLVGDLIGLVRHLGLERPVLLGQSLGGSLSQAVVRAEPELAAALVVIDSAWNTGPLTGLERWLLGLAAPGLRLIPARSLPGVMAKASAVTPSVIEQATQTFARMPKPDFVEVWKATTGFIAPDPAYRIPVPLLLVRGAEDRTGNIRTAMLRWASAEGVDEHVVAGAGHLANLDAPEAVNELLAEFLQRVHA